MMKSGRIYWHEGKKETHDIFLRHGCTLDSLLQSIDYLTNIVQLGKLIVQIYQAAVITIMV